MIEEDMLQKLKMLEMERAFLKNSLKLLRASKKIELDLSAFQPVDPTSQPVGNFRWLTPKEETAISLVVEKYLGQEQVQAVVSACDSYRDRYRAEVMEMRRENLARFKQGQMNGRGRPKGSKDHAAKRTVRKLAAVWEKAKGKGKLPRQQESAFGDFVEKIAGALQVKDAKGNLATWRGQVNDVLRHQQPDTAFLFPELLDTPQAIASYQCIQQACQEAFIQVVYKMCEKFEFEARIKELPRSEEFDVSVQCKTLLKQEDITK